MQKSHLILPCFTRLNPNTPFYLLDWRVVASSNLLCVDWSRKNDKVNKAINKNFKENYLFMIDIHNKNYIPALEEMVEYINNPVFLLFCNDVKTKYNCKEQIEFSSCSWEYGWNVKFKKSGKTLCTIYPCQSYLARI